MPAARTVRVLAIQPALRWLQPMPNMHTIRQLVEQQVASAPADVLVLPEAFNGLPSDYDPSAGPAARQFLGTLARACHVSVIGGSIDYADETEGRRNTCFVVDRDGREVGGYHKRVLFNEERHSRRAGLEPGIFELAGLRVGVLICADLWEPAYARELAGRVDLLCVPAKTTVPAESHVNYARGLWWNLALTRAMENGLPIVVSDWSAGRQEAVALADGTKVRSVHYTSGATSITDPSRRPDLDAIQRQLAPGMAGALSATIDLEAMARFRDYRRSVGLLPDA